ncbi:MAG: YebC/PmpR family DNA-binding transcriptional regulator [Candidatus Sumerlaeia bacterium]|nr:YebC/PmpR family DNA-binding transcriptional regulator [Candidatus Sumerlaeia bacterium]
MSGHSKWHSIKHKKGAIDAKRGKLFTSLIKELTIAARIGGGNPGGNPRLRTAVAAAKAASMPKDTIERAIKRGTGEIEGAEIIELTYEGYGPGGVAIFVEASSDNRNRTAGEIRSLFSKNGGNMAEPGAVAYMFTKRGVITLEGADEDRVMETALEAGALDVQSDGSTVTVLTEPMAMEDVREALGKAGLSATAAEIQNLPSTTVKVEGKEAASLMKLLSALEDHDDVDRVSANFEMSDELMEQLSA